jgi:hypothetical protein
MRLVAPCHSPIANGGGEAFGGEPGKIGFEGVHGVPILVGGGDALEGIWEERRAGPSGSGALEGWGDPSRSMSLWWPAGSAKRCSSARR